MLMRRAVSVSVSVLHVLAIAAASALSAAAMAGSLPPRFDGSGAGVVAPPEAPGPALPGVLCRTCPQSDGSLLPSTLWRTQPGSLGPGDCALYRVPVSAGRQYRFTFCEGGGAASFDTVLTAFDAGCAPSASNDDSCGALSALNVTPASSGYVYIRVTDKRSAGGTFRLAYKDLGISPAACGTCPAFNFGTYVPSTTWKLHSSSVAEGSCKLYRFQVQLHRSYRFSFCEGGGTASFDTRLQVFSGACVPGATADDSCGMLSDLTVTAAASGYIYVKVTSNGPGGSYTLAHRDVTGTCQTCPNYNFGTFTPGTEWSTHAASVAAGGCQLYRFRLDANESYRFGSCDGGGFASFDSILEIYSYDGTSCTLVASNDDSCGTASSLDFAPSATGYYYVRVAPKSSGGSYRLAWTQLCQWACPPPDFGPFVPPKASYDHQSGIVPAGGCRIFAYDLQAGADYVFTLCGVDPWGLLTGSSADFDSLLLVTDANCSTLAFSDDACGAQSQVTYTPASSGRYYLELYGYTGGSYTLGWSRNCADDTDGDRIADCWETGTNVFVDSSDTGTDPADPDTDDDSISDGDELYGTVAGLDLPSLGAHPLRRDLFLEYDWFECPATGPDGCNCSPCGAHTHEPNQAMLDLVEQAFAAAPLTNPDGSTGVRIHQDRGQGGAFVGGNFIDDTNRIIAGGVTDGFDTEFDAHKSAHFDAIRHGYFHYVIFAHQYGAPAGCSSGLAELPGDDFIVSLGCCISDTNVAFAIMHELGHNLGLGHGGGTGCNYKPNYNSIMNYRYTFPGIDSTCDAEGDLVLDYSRNLAIALNESSLNEPQGICGLTAINWNGDGDATDVGLSLDVNPYADELAHCGAILQVLTDYDDWGNIVLDGITTGDADADFRLKRLQPAVVREIVVCDNPAPAP